MRVALAQIAPVVFDRDACLAKVLASVRAAAKDGARLVVFGEAVVPGYPVWIERADGARFDSPEQKSFHARYSEAAVQIERGDLDELCSAARQLGIAISLGVIERPTDRGGHSLYCSSVFVAADGRLASTHRKLVPTYEERLTWSPGDGHGLATHALDGFQVGALLCWENWMPLARAALYAQGEDLHLAHWPGAERNTRPLTRFLAREGRSYAVSVCGLLRGRDLPRDVRERLGCSKDELLCDGGSCAAGPDGRWLLEPQVGREGLHTVDLDPVRVREERQSFDPSGHYARPDVLQLGVDRRRQTTLVERTPRPRNDP